MVRNHQSAEFGKPTILVPVSSLLHPPRSQLDSAHEERVMYGAGGERWGVARHYHRYRCWLLYLRNRCLLDTSSNLKLLWYITVHEFINLTALRFINGVSYEPESQGRTRSPRAGSGTSLLQINPTSTWMHSQYHSHHSTYASKPHSMLTRLTRCPRHRLCSLFEVTQDL